MRLNLEDHVNDNGREMPLYIVGAVLGSVSSEHFSGDRPRVYFNGAQAYKKKTLKNVTNFLNFLYSFINAVSGYLNTLKLHGCDSII